MRLMFTIALLLFTSLEACTGVLLRPKDGSHVHGRTVEFGVFLDTSVVVVPRGTSFVGKTPIGDGLSYQSKYASVGIMTFDDLNILDGMNEKGLSVGAFYFPDFSSYAAVTAKDQHKGLSPIDFSNWILTQFSSVDEVRKAIEEDQVIVTPTVLENWGSEPPPFHYIVYDKSGKSLVIEPIAGELVLYDNPLGVITNAPPFDWHLTNLRNYIGLHARNVEPRSVGQYTIYPLGQGSGLIGLPGDFTPPSRFVRAAIFSMSALPETTAEKGIFQTFHILNNFDIPIGVAREETPKGLTTDYTMLTVARDPQSLRYYFRTHEDQTIRMVDLKTFDFSGKQVKKLATKHSQPVVDVTRQLQ